MDTVDGTINSLVNSLMCSNSCPCAPEHEPVWQAAPVEDYGRSWDANSTEYLNFTGSYVDFASCYADLMADNSTQQLVAEIETHSDGALVLTTLLESNHKCSGFCKSPLFTFSKPLSDGLPETTCISSLTTEVSEYQLWLGISSIITGVFTLASWVMQFCLWRKFEV